MERLADRLTEGRAALDRLRPAIESGEPWPLSRAYGAEPESDWGPKEVLAHVAEMVPYWLAQAEAILAAPLDPAEPPPFGRIATDPARIASIGHGRTRPAIELLARIDAGLADVLARLDALSPAERTRRGVHPRLGEMTTEAVLERFIVGHLEEHVRQLEEILALRATARPDETG